MSKQRVDATSAYESQKKPTVYDKMIAPKEPEHPVTEQEKSEEEKEAKTMHGGRILKQVAFAIGKERERKLDTLAFEYNQRKGTRIGRNDIARYLFDSLTLDELLRIDLKAYKK